MKLIYDVHDRPGLGKTLLFAFQQLLAIVSATIAVPMIVGNGLQPSAALFGAGIATIIYLLITKFKSPVFFGSSFAFIGSMCAAFAGATSMQLGYLGIIIGSAMAGLISIIAGILVKCFGTKWIYKVLPYAVIGPVVAIIGLSLAGTAVSAVLPKTVDGIIEAKGWVSLAVAMVTLFSTIAVATYGKRMMKLVPFAIGIGIGYVLSLILTGIGHVASIDALKVIDFTPFTQMQWYPDFTFLTAIEGAKELTWEYVGTVALAFVPVSIVTLTEHLADHQNLSTIVERDLFKDPGLHRTLIGDGLADAVGAALGGCSTTSYGESVGCVALTKNASTISIFTAALMAVVVSFIAPISALLSTIPSCVLNAVCFLLYGFIAVSGLKMLKKVNLEDNKNVFVVSVILIAGVGGLTLSFGQITITTVACSLILGILANVLVSFKKDTDDELGLDSEETSPVETIPTYTEESHTSRLEALEELLGRDAVYYYDGDSATVEEDNDYYDDEFESEIYVEDDSNNFTEETAEEPTTDESSTEAEVFFDEEVYRKHLCNIYHIELCEFISTIKGMESGRKVENIDKIINMIKNPESLQALTAKQLDTLANFLLLQVKSKNKADKITAILNDVK